MSAQNPGQNTLKNKVEKQAGEKRWGCTSPPPQFTTPGNAGRSKGFRDSRRPNSIGVANCGLCSKWGCNAQKWRCYARFIGVAIVLHKSSLLGKASIALVRRCRTAQKPGSSPNPLFKGLAQNPNHIPQGIYFIPQAVIA